jgi:pilus assembly protein Flp/PilA
MFNLPEREEGQGLVEYALILVLVAIAAIIILAVLGSTVALVYVRVVGGLNGQSLTSSGVEYMVLSANVGVTGGGSSCNVTISDATVAVISDGKMLTNSPSVSIPVSAPGGSSSMSGTTDNLGLASGLSGSLSGVTCGSKLTIGNTGYGAAINP